MKLTDLQPQFLRRVSNSSYVDVDTLAEADGILFLCPKCFHSGSTHVGCHSELCWFRGKVPDDCYPGPGRWTPSGTGYNDLTFVPGEPKQATSVLNTTGCKAHYLVENGEVRLV